MEIELYIPDASVKLERPLIKDGISAGFPSPAEDYLEETLDLNSLVKNPQATFYGKVRGDSMTDEGLNDGDILVIDRSLEPRNGAIAVCCIDGQFTVKKIKLEDGACWLMPANNAYKPVRVSEGNEFIVWGIVSHVVSKKY